MRKKADWRCKEEQLARGNREGKEDSTSSKVIRMPRVLGVGGDRRVGDLKKVREVRADQKRRVACCNDLALI